MDRSDDLTRNRRFNALELGSDRTRPRIVTAKDERVAPRGPTPANRAPQPSLEFRARQRLRTYAEAATVMDRQSPRDASAAVRKNTDPSSEAPVAPAAATASPAATPGYGEIIPEPPSPMAESYVGRRPQITQREAQTHNLAPSAALSSDDQAGQDDAFEPAPIMSASTEAAIESPAITAPIEAEDNLAEAMSSPQDEATIEFADANALIADEPQAFQSAATSGTAEGAGGVAGTARAMIAKSSATVQNFTSKSASVAKSLVANAGLLWQKTIQRVSGQDPEAASLSNTAAPSGVGVKGRVSRLPANSLLTPQVGSLAAAARADAANARPDANVRPVQSEGVLNQEPEPRRTLLARKIQDNVERTEARAVTPSGPITQTRRGGMALSSLALIVTVLVFLAAAVWATVSIMQRTSTPVTTIGQTERYRIEAVLDALFIDPGAVDGVIDARTTAAIAVYASEYGYTGPLEISAPLLQHLETEAEAMGVLDLIQ
ncbi:MAG: hypothetical protein ACPG42_03390 [Alphaproteobacteria bacterium]